MAKVILDTMLESVSSRLGNVVYSEWKGIKYAKKYKKPKDAGTVAQVEVRTTFSKAVVYWKPLPDAVKKGWEFHVKGKPMTGYNLFFKTNFTGIKNGETLKLAKGTGVTAPSNMVSEINSAGDISVSFDMSDDAAFVSLFVYKKGETDMSLTVKTDVDTSSMPVVLSGFDPASEYGVYAIASNAPMDSAGYISDSAGCDVTK